jgi:hypothetical protein
MHAWVPISATDLDRLLRKQLAICPPELVAVFERYKVVPFRAPLQSDILESAFVVARKGNEALYYEDVEEGFNFSPMSERGQLLEHWCNQDELRFALLRWKE